MENRGLENMRKLKGFRTIDAKATQKATNRNLVFFSL